MTKTGLACSALHRNHAAFCDLDDTHTTCALFRTHLKANTAVDKHVAQLQAGWDFAVGALLSTGTMQRVSDVPNIADDAESVAAFFGNVCAARGSNLTINAPVVNANGTGTQWEELCGACQVTTPLHLAQWLLVHATPCSGSVVCHKPRL